MGFAPNSVLPCPVVAIVAGTRFAVVGDRVPVLSLSFCPLYRGHLVLAVPCHCPTLVAVVFRTGSPWGTPVVVENRVVVVPGEVALPPVVDTQVVLERYTAACGAWSATGSFAVARY